MRILEELRSSALVATCIQISRGLAAESKGDAKIQSWKVPTPVVLFIRLKGFHAGDVRHDAIDLSNGFCIVLSLRLANEDG